VREQARVANRRGGRAEHFEVDETISLPPEKAEELVMVHEALTRLANFDKRKAMISSTDISQDLQSKNSQIFRAFDSND